MAENLIPSTSIPLQSWMRSAASQKIMGVLNPDTKNPSTLFVGGCVRNALLGEEVGDIDIATKFTPDEVIKLLEEHSVKVIPTGLDHGTVTAVIEDQSFEITTLRRDVETDGRHAVVAFTKDWAEDARRRDFTMNTLLADAEGNIYDPLGSGLGDLRARRLIFVGQPAQRIQEDYLRILRFFRFHAFYGEGEMDSAGLAACREYADQIKTLSRERITQEFFKILSADAPHTVLRIMFDHGVLKDFALGDAQLTTLQHVTTFQKRYGLSALSSRLYVLAGMDLNTLDQFAKTLLIPKVFMRDAQMLHQALSMDDLSDDMAVKICIYKCGRAITAQALMIELAIDRVMNGDAPKAIKTIQNWEVPNFPLSGEDLIKEGFEPGPALGAELQKREEEWINNGFR